MGFEPTTPSLGSWYSTTELRPRSSLVENKDKELYLSKLYHVKHYCSRTIRFKVLIFAATKALNENFLTIFGKAELSSAKYLLIEFFRMSNKHQITLLCWGMVVYILSLDMNCDVLIHW
jgi:hypothetical protein